MASAPVLVAARAHARARVPGVAFQLARQSPVPSRGSVARAVYRLSARHRLAPARPARHLRYPPRLSVFRCAVVLAALARGRCLQAAGSVELVAARIRAGYLANAPRTPGPLPQPEFVLARRNSGKPCYDR